jgi:hypothetical protein
MLKKILILVLALFIFMNAACAMDDSNWTDATVGFEEFKIPPQYEHPYKSDFNLYQYDDDIDEFTIRYANPNIMSLYGYFLERNSHIEKVVVAGHDAVHFSSYDRHDGKNNSKLWFSAGEEFYYITWRGTNITPAIQAVVNSSSPSAYNHTEFYSILDDEYQTYRIVDAIESQRYDYPRGDDGPHTFYTVGTNGFGFGVIS